MSFLCKNLEYATCPFEITPRESVCRSTGVCELEEVCPATGDACEMNCNETECKAMPEEEIE